jgi:hypothetical protein
VKRILEGQKSFQKTILHRNFMFKKKRSFWKAGGFLF